MAWVTPRTWTDGEAPTAAQFNQDMRDNLAWLIGSGTDGRMGFSVRAPNINVNYNTYTTPSWNAFDWNPQSMVNVSNIIYTPAPGVYLVEGQSYVETVGQASLGLYIYDGVSGYVFAYDIRYAANTPPVSPVRIAAGLSCRSLIRLNGSQGLYMHLYHLCNSASNLYFAPRLQAMGVR